MPAAGLMNRWRAGELTSRGQGLKTLVMSRVTLKYQTRTLRSKMDYKIKISTLMLQSFKVCRY